MKLLLSALLLAACTAHAQSLPGSERVEFAKIFGHLYKPAGAGKRPAIVIVHGSGGVSNARQGFWASELAAMGMVALVTDSFTPRGVESTVEDQSRVTTTQMVRDAFDALDFLARQDFVDEKRVAVLGMSKGGSVALLAADKRAQRSGRAFAAHVPLYPGCTIQYRNPQATAPILMLIGEADTYTGIKSCAAYIERIRAAGGKVDLKTYKGAHHAFDGDPSNEREFFLPRAQNFRDCVAYIEDDANITMFDKGCIRLGASVAANARARAQALEDAKAFLKTTLSF